MTRDYWRGPDSQRSWSGRNERRADSSSGSIGIGKRTLVQAEMGRRGRRVMRQADSGEVSSQAKELLQRALASAGMPLPEQIRIELEHALGVDLGEVRIHSSAESAAAADAVAARAFTVGTDIHFGQGQFDPNSKAGRKLIAHEVAHTVQSPVANDNQLDVSQPGEAHEQEADRFADSFVLGSAIIAGVEVPNAQAAIKAKAPPITPNSAAPKISRQVASELSGDQGNAVITVRLYRKGKRLKSWSGPMETDKVNLGKSKETYVAVRQGQTWNWNGQPDAATITINAPNRKDKGEPVERWAKRSKATRIVVEITHNRGGQSAEGTGAGAGDASDDPQSEVGRENKTSTEVREPGGHEDGVEGGDPNGVLGGSIDGHEDGDADDGAVDGRRGGNGGRKLGSVKGDPDGSVNGKLGGEQGGIEHDGWTKNEGGVLGGSLNPDSHEPGETSGAKGGIGKPGDQGARGAMALFPVVSIPAAARAAVELALIAMDAGAADALIEKLILKGLSKLGVKGARKLLAKEARKWAKQQMKNEEVLETLAGLEGAELKKAKAATEYALQREYFKQATDWAKAERATLEAALEAAPGDEHLLKALDDVAIIEEAAGVVPAGANLPKNHEYAGKAFPLADDLAEKYPAGVNFTKEGYPDFEPHIYREGEVVGDVRIDYTGSRRDDFKAANAAAGLDKTPEDWVWHHHEDLGRMILIPEELHDAVKHTGGVAHYKAITGDTGAYKN